MIDRYLERNGIRLHIADTELLLSHGWQREFISKKCYSVGNGIYVTNRLSLGLMAEFTIEPGISYDFAMPAPYIDGHIWIYDDLAPIFGRAYNLRVQFYKVVTGMLKEANLI
jgi:hypothetical protein